MVDIKKSLILDEEYLKNNGRTVSKIVKQLNHVLNGKVEFSVGKEKIKGENKDVLSILVYEENLKSHAGRPKGHDFDYAKVQQMKAEGKTNKEIYTELGVSKALYYLRMKEYKQ